MENKHLSGVPGVKEIAIDMILNVPDDISDEEVSDRFVAWVEVNGWLCGGGIRELTQKDYDEIQQEMKQYNYD